MEETFSPKAIKLLRGLTIIEAENDCIVFDNGLAIILSNKTIRELNEVAS